LQGPRPGSVVQSVAVPERTGMSSLTVVLEVASEGRTEHLVARIAPESTAVPVFPRYEFAKQFAVIDLVATSSRAPVPRPLFFEPDTSVLGSEFILMEHVDGLVPPDVMPYTFGSWLSEAPQADQRRLQDAAVDALARVHDTPLSIEVGALLDPAGDERSPLVRHVDGLLDYYRWCAEEGVRVPLLEAGFEFLAASWPADEGRPVLSWGDSRIGNMIFREFEPVALLDWEMVGYGPRELDLGWMIYLHRWFDDIAHSFGLVPMRDFMRVDEVVVRYEEASGERVSPSLRWYLFYAALRHGVIMSRVTTRQIAFGEASMPEDPDDLVMHRRALEQMMDGSYWHGFDC
jgi:aminoglycoside phosphotransferase (APT) family kinase protein